MESFEKITFFVIKILLLMSIIQMYLRVNKIWKRKHEREVAESQSIVGLSLLMINCIIWIIYYIITKDYSSIIDTSIMVLETSVFLLVSTGLWVKGQKRLGFWKSFRQALKLESKEADYLIKKFFKPLNAEKIIEILHQLAMIDDEYDPKEQALIEAFAKEWNIHYSPEALNKELAKVQGSRYMLLRRKIEDYIEREPPKEQVAQLKDMITTMIQADDKISKEEELISSEIQPMLENYLVEEDILSSYNVIIVPQEPQHEILIQEMFPLSKKINTAGGIAYPIGTYYSYNFAEMICNQYRELNLFTIVQNPIEIKNNNT